MSHKYSINKLLQTVSVGADLCDGSEGQDLNGSCNGSVLGAPIHFSTDRFTEIYALKFSHLSRLIMRSVKMR
jgi:hypothetical protein